MDGPGHALAHLNLTKRPRPSCKGEGDAAFHGRKLEEFHSFLDDHEHEIGVLLVEPQVGGH